MYKLIESYDAGGDLSKDWFVKFHFLIPDILKKPGESNWERFKVLSSINRIKSKVERRKQLRIVKKGVTYLLKHGFNPFEEFNLCSNVSYSGHTISNCIVKYLDEIRHDVKASTLRKYTVHVNLFDKWLSDKGLNMKMIYSIDKSIIYSFLKENQAKKEWSNKTYNHYLNAIHALFQHFINNHDGYVEKNPCAKMKRLQPMKRGNRPFDNHEFKTTIEYLKSNHLVLYNFCRFGYYSCMRPDAEARLIKIGDIDLLGRRIRIGNEITKGKATQVIPIDDEFASFLEELELHKYPRSFYLFGKGGRPGEKPAHEKYFCTIFRPIKKMLELHRDVTLYAFKHTRVIHMVEDGEDLYNIIKFTRHKSLANLMDYLKDMGVIIGEKSKFKSRKI